MATVLFLAHRIPYPPDKGDKIRSYHVLRHLAREHDVILGAFVDDPDDWRHREVLDELCAEVQLFPLDPRRARIRSLTGLCTGEALSLPYYRNGRLADWVASHSGVDAAYAFSSTMAAYLLGPRWGGVRRVFDFVDVDSDKWRQYAERKRGPMRWIYARESRRLLDFERRAANEADLTVFVSDDEARLFRELSGVADAVGLPNGVDVDYFDPRAELETVPMAGDGPHFVFTGAMDYWANVDAVTWFADEVLPAARDRWPAARFVIVGSKPTRDVLALGGREGIDVTGRVPDVRPYLRQADVVVAPLRIARGIQNKVLEAMSMARPVVATPAAAAGIEAESGRHLLVADGTAPSVEALAAALTPEAGASLARAARERILERYSWDAALSALDGWLSPAPAKPEPAPR